MTKGYYGRSYEHGLNAKSIRTKNANLHNYKDFLSYIKDGFSDGEYSIYINSKNGSQAYLGGFKTKKDVEEFINSTIISKDMWNIMNNHKYVKEFKEKSKLNGWSKVPSVMTGGKSYFYTKETTNGRFWVVWDRIYNKWVIKDGFDKFYGKFDNPQKAFKEFNKIIGD